MRRTALLSVIAAVVLTGAPALAAPAVPAPVNPAPLVSSPHVTAKAQPQAAQASGIAGTFVSLPPARILDTAHDLGAPGPVAAHGTVTVAVAGRGGVPASGVAAVAVNVTVVGPQQHGYLTAYPAGTSRPATSTLNFAAGQAVANLADVRLGTGGISIYNASAGTARIIADVSGYYLAGTPTAAGAFVSLPPSRILDTAHNLGANGPAPAHGTVTVAVAGHGGVPTTGVAAVAVNVTVVGPQQHGYLTAYPAGTTRPATSTLNFAAGQAVANLATVRLGGGRISIYNASAGTARIIADVSGYYLAGTPAAAGAFVSLPPSRILDTAHGLGANPPSAYGTLTADVAGHGGVPDSGATAVAANVTVVGPQQHGYLTAYPAGTSRPATSTLNFAAGQAVANQADIRLGNGRNGVGGVSIYNASAGTARIIADVSGYFLTGPPAGAVLRVGTVATSSTTEYQDWNWANPDPVFTYATPGGDLGIARYDAGSDTLSAAAYDASTRQVDGATTTISLTGWPDWGGFYAAPDGDYYVLVGRDNPDEDDSRDVVAVRRYDASWHLLGTAYVQGGATQGGVKGIVSPFEAGHPHMVLVGDRLVVHMSRLIYAIQGVHHQVNLTFEVNTGTMIATTFDELGDVAYSSHSFQQLVTTNGSDLVMIDHGDAYPRAVQLGVMANYPTQRDVSTYDLFDFNGQIGDNFTGASVNALVSGPQGVVVLGDSIAQPDAPDGPLGSDAEQRNVFAISADPATGAHTVHWLTAFPANGSNTGLEPRAVQVGNDEFAVLFGVSTGASNRLEYRLIDSAGNVLASATFPGVFHASICDPVLVGDTVYWVGDEPGASDPAPAYLYGLDVSDPTHPVVAP